MKGIEFKGNTRDVIRSFPVDVRREVGYQLDRLQRGEEPTDWKLMRSVGLGVREIRIRDESGAYRVIYVAKFAETIYVLSAFQKKTQKTPQDEINLARRHLSEIKR